MVNKDPVNEKRGLSIDWSNSQEIHTQRVFKRGCLSKSNEMKRIKILTKWNT